MKRQTGLTLIETLAALSIFSLALAAVFTFIIQGMKSQNMQYAQLVAQTNARSAFKTMTTELRGVQYSAEGSYPIAIAENNNLIFYSDIDSDGITERLRYFLDGTEFKKGRIDPTGAPLKYVLANEQVTTLTKDIQMNSQPIFKYYEGTYTGTENPLTLPINIGKVRLIHITLIIDANINRTPPALTIETEVVLRNLKDNL